MYDVILLVRSYVNKVKVMVIPLSSWSSGNCEGTCSRAANDSCLRISHDAMIPYSFDRAKSRALWIKLKPSNGWIIATT